MPGKKVNFDAVRKVALALPGVEESTLHGAPSFKVTKRLLVCPAIHKSAEPNSLMVRIGFDQRVELLAENPKVYYVTDHYADYPGVLVRLDQIDLKSLKKLLAMAWESISSKKKAKR